MLVEMTWLALSIRKYAESFVCGFLGVTIILTPEDTIYGKFHLTAYSLAGL